MTTGTIGNDSLTANDMQTVIGGLGDDTLISAQGSSTTALVGGQGNDLYEVGAGSGTLIFEHGASAADTVTLADDLNEYTFYTTPGGHLVGVDDNNGAALIVFDWRDPLSRIETWNVNGHSYNYNDFVHQVFNSNYDGERSLDAIFDTESADTLRQAFTYLNGVETATEKQEVDNAYANDPAYVYRFYDTATGTHFYTNNPYERDAVLQNDQQFSFEGPRFQAATSGADQESVFRFYNAGTGDHFYTADPNESAAVQAHNAAYHYEGVAYQAHSGNSAGTEALYRFYDTANGTHFYTTDTAERDNTIAHLHDYHYEGVAYYVEPLHA